MNRVKTCYYWLGVVNFVQQSTKPKIYNYLRSRSGRAIKEPLHAQFWPVLTPEAKLVSKQKITLLFIK